MLSEISQIEEDKYCISFACGGGALVPNSCLIQTPKTVAHQAPLFMRFPRQGREWVAICFSNYSNVDSPLKSQCKEIKENNRMGKTRNFFKKTRDTKGNFMQRWV